MLVSCLAVAGRVLLVNFPGTTLTRRCLSPWLTTAMYVHFMIYYPSWPVFNQSFEWRRWYLGQPSAGKYTEQSNSCYGVTNVAAAGKTSPHYQYTRNRHTFVIGCHGEATLKAHLEVLITLAWYAGAASVCDSNEACAQRPPAAVFTDPAPADQNTRAW